LLFLFLPSSKTRVSSSPPPPLRDALATLMRLIRSIRVRSALQKSTFFFISPPLHGHAGSSHYRIGSDLEAPAASSRLPRNWRWWAFAPFAALWQPCGLARNQRKDAGVGNQTTVLG
jgi:hypothetical protein